MDFSIIIPAQESNKYHKLGDLAPFGDTTLLEWKISQCKEFVKPSKIYISSYSQLIEEIATKEEVNFIKRDSELDYQSMLCNSIEAVEAENIVWINTTSPFMDFNVYKKMCEKYKNENLTSLVSVEKISEYTFFNNKKLNFSDDFTPREKLEPIYIMTNGCYVINKAIALQCKNLLSSNPMFFEVDSFLATEIKDVQDYSIARDMISIYFKKEFNV
ncbi:cytidylyltransferase domain-containing protein [Sulfurimonas sp.]|uniref:cytidylyltransferase domain-containing protein n=1 Tax=Sulfurimonas sp. TaxID=2022749 RepID=UPI003D0EAF47